LEHALIIEDDGVVACNVETIRAKRGDTSFDALETEAEQLHAAEQLQRADLVAADERVDRVSIRQTICARRLAPTVHILGVVGDASLGRPHGMDRQALHGRTADRGRSASSQPD